jgi:hypothetical protein
MIKTQSITKNYSKRRLKRLGRVKNARKKKRKESIERWRDANFVTLPSCNPGDLFRPRKSPLLRRAIDSPASMDLRWIRVSQGLLIYSMIHRTNIN